MTDKQVNSQSIQNSPWNVTSAQIILVIIIIEYNISKLETTRLFFKKKKGTYKR